MCVYCMIGDAIWKTNPPWGIPKYPSVPTQPYNPGWDYQRLKELQEILERVKKLEDRLGCPCDEAEDRNKPDYIGLIQQKLDLTKE